MPILRWFKSKKIPKNISIFAIVLILAAFFKIGIEVIQLSSHEILSADQEFLEKAETKIVNAVVYIEQYFGAERLEGEDIVSHYFHGNNSVQSFGSVFTSIQSGVTIILMTMFFLILLLSESINFETLMNKAIFKKRQTSIKTFVKIENDILKFVKVKFVVSLLTGIGFSLACWSFDISFPIFWGLFAFLINFIQMIGSVISVIMLSLFALVEIDSSGTLLFFVLTISAVQVLFGGIIEPIMMGRTFSLNIITVLIMLMFWGFIWGVPGLIMSIPITVFIKIALEQFPKTKVIAGFMAGSESKKKLA
ncbi:MAG: AI-2E family transporter [Crocinitomix sp.]|nr:AI-2E family transporter [Crocinitomix sp.]